MEPLINGTLYERVKVEDSIWSLEDNSKVIITLEKAGDHIWKTVIRGDAEIDTTKVDNSK